MVELGRRIRKMRKQKQLTLAQLSKVAQVSIGTISQIETGKQTSLNSRSAVALATALGVPIEWLFSASVHKRGVKLAKSGGAQ